MCNAHLAKKIIPLRISKTSLFVKMFVKKHSCCKPCPPTIICYVKKSNCSSILNTHFRQRSSSKDIFSRNMWHARISSGDPCPKSFLTALAQQAELPATWANSFSSWKASIAASILVQVLGEAVLSRVFKHCGHCTAPGLKAAMHLPQHPQNQVWVFFCSQTFFVLSTS